MARVSLEKEMRMYKGTQYLWVQNIYKVIFKRCKDLHYQIIHKLSS